MARRLQANNATGAGSVSWGVGGRFSWRILTPVNLLSQAADRGYGNLLAAGGWSIETTNETFMHRYRCATCLRYEGTSGRQYVLWPGEPVASGVRRFVGRHGH